MTPQPDEEQPQDTDLTPQPFEEGSSLVDPVDEVEDQIDSRSVKSGKSSKSTKTVTFDGSANEKSSQTESKICGMIIYFREYATYKSMIDIHKKAVTFHQKRRDAKHAEKEFTRAKHLVKVFKQIEESYEWNFYNILIIND